MLIGHAIAQVVSRQLPTKADQAQSQLLLPIFIPPAAPHSIVILSIML
jgi:hypothetical protein